eukprot:gene23522-9045_t
MVLWDSTLDDDDMDEDGARIMSRKMLNISANPIESLAGLPSSLVSLNISKIGHSCHQQIAHLADLCPNLEGCEAWAVGGKDAERAARLECRNERRRALRRTAVSFAIERARRRVIRSIENGDGNVADSQLLIFGVSQTEDTEDAVRRIVDIPSTVDPDIISHFRRGKYSRNQGPPSLDMHLPPLCVDMASPMDMTSSLGMTSPGDAVSPPAGDCEPSPVLSHIHASDLASAPGTSTPPLEASKYTSPPYINMSSPMDAVSPPAGDCEPSPILSPIDASDLASAPGTVTPPLYASNVTSPPCAEMTPPIDDQSANLGSGEADVPKEGRAGSVKAESISGATTAAEEECVVCSEGLEEGDPVLWLPCDHCFHEGWRPASEPSPMSPAPRHSCAAGGDSGCGAGGAAAAAAAADADAGCGSVSEDSMHQQIQAMYKKSFGVKSKEAESQLGGWKAMLESRRGTSSTDNATMASPKGAKQATTTSTTSPNGAKPATTTSTTSPNGAKPAITTSTTTGTSVLQAVSQARSRATPAQAKPSAPSVQPSQAKPSAQGASGETATMAPLKAPLNCEIVQGAVAGAAPRLSSILRSARAGVRSESLSIKMGQGLSLDGAGDEKEGGGDEVWTLPTSDVSTRELDIIDAISLVRLPSMRAWIGCRRSYIRA